MRDALFGGTLSRELDIQLRSHDNHSSVKHGRPTSKSSRPGTSLYHERPPRPSPEQVDAKLTRCKLTRYEFQPPEKNSAKRAQVSAILGKFKLGELPPCIPESKKLNLKLPEGRQSFTRFKTYPV